MSDVVLYVLVFLAAPIPGMVLGWAGFTVWKWLGNDSDR